MGKVFQGNTSVARFDLDRDRGRIELFGYDAGDLIGQVFLQHEAT